ncbi:uncharacterized protein HKW66_Vig0045900 [Vigna angularis]|uniref:Uncharacterized protein n=1 Tax=Phaseolus angularis TaxID=3914 RepID=A0A8T0L5R7_PHAAN|nr:uncharacterized protein HKW66_Vig0045900 [Vigna angularis]
MNDEIGRLYLFSGNLYIRVCELWHVISILFSSNSRGRLNITAIDTNNLTVDPFSSISGQEPHNRSHVFGLTQPPQRTLLHDPIHSLLRLPLKEHLRCDGPRRHAVRRDLRSLQFLRQNLHHRLHRSLRRSVNTEPRPQRRHLRRRHQNDPPPAASLQPVRRLPRAHKRTARVHREGVVEGLHGGVPNGGVRAVEDACRVDQDVDRRVKGALGRVKEGLDLARFGHVSLDHDGPRRGGVGVDLSGN